MRFATYLEVVLDWIDHVEGLNSGLKLLGFDHCNSKTNQNQFLFFLRHYIANADSRGASVNISSVIVIPRPDTVQVVVDGLNTLPGVEVAVVSPEGKIIVTIETEGDRETIQTYEVISQLDGVMSASMVYHQQESEPEVEISVEA